MGELAPDAGESLGIVLDVDAALGLNALQHPLRTLYSRLGPTRDHRSVLGIGDLVRLIVREYPAARILYLTAAPPALTAHVRRALRVDGYPPGRLYAPARTAGTFSGAGARHKRDVLARILPGSPRRWVLIGDNTGADPALFAHVARHARVAAIAIWHQRHPDPGSASRVRARAPQVPVIAAPTGQGLVTDLATTFGLARRGRISEWFLTDVERGNEATALPAWTEGNEARAIIDGRRYLTELGEAIEATGPGDTVLLTGWRADAHQRLGSVGAGRTLAAAARRGALVRVLLWRAHSELIGYHAPQNRGFAKAVTNAGGRALLDHRVRRFGSHHQKQALIRYADEPWQDVAFLGGIDVAAARRDDEQHRGDRFTRPLARAYGTTPAWHDVQLRLAGPAVADAETTFTERWAETGPLVRAPWRVAVDALHGLPRRADRLPPSRPPPPAAGTCAVQLLRTYPRRTPSSSFAPRGERSIARAYAKALVRAQRLVYVEDQYLWSEDVARVFAAALHRAPALHIIAVVPRHPDQESPIQAPAARLGQGSAMELVNRVGGERVQVLNLEHEDGRPIYVHDKICIVDDVWALVGSANLNRRSWTHDSELAAAVLDARRDPRSPADPAGLGDGARPFARDLRLDLLREHLGRAAGDDADLIDPDEAAATVRAAASALDRWHHSGRTGKRPPGRLREHRIGARPRWWAHLATSAFYQTVFDPDGRGFGMRMRRTF